VSGAVITLAGCGEDAPRSPSNPDCSALCACASSLEPARGWPVPERRRRTGSRTVRLRRLLPEAGQRQALP